VNFKESFNLYKKLGNFIVFLTIVFAFIEKDFSTEMVSLEFPKLIIHDEVFH